MSKLQAFVLNAKVSIRITFGIHRWLNEQEGRGFVCIKVWVPWGIFKKLCMFGFTKMATVHGVSRNSFFLISLMSVTAMPLS
ncbi:MAG: hypothetical protein QX196_07755 [Methylococcaceae bacterium]